MAISTGADAGFEQALQALLDGRRLSADAAPDSGAGESPYSETSTGARNATGAYGPGIPGVSGASGCSSPDPTPLDALRVLALVAQAHRVALFGEDHEPSDPQALTRWGHLEVGHEVGRGASGTVYRAWDTHLAREVALKLLDRNTTSSDAALGEGRLLARLRHPHIVTVFGADVHGGVAGLWMEFVRGDTLDEVLARDGLFGLEEALLVGIDVASALAAVHAAGLLHRDVKTRNVVRECGGRIVLMDLGAGRPADQTPANGDATGTPLYMAPEVLAGGNASVRSDVYSLGVVLYRLLTGAFPIEAARDVAGLRVAHASGRAIPLRGARPDLPLEVVDAIERAHDPDPNERYATAVDLETALRRALGRTLVATRHVRSTRARAWARWRRPVAASIAAAAMLGTVIGLGWHSNPGRAARRTAGLAVPPRSPLYLTMGGAIGVVRGSRLDLMPYNPADATAIAVSADLGIHTLAGKPPWTGGAWFGRDGKPRRAPSSPGAGRCCFYDGTTDGQFNYAISSDSTLLDPIGSRPVEPPTLYRFARDWSHPEPMFVLRPSASAPQVTSYYFGLTYDAESDSFWTTLNEADGATIEQWSREGRRLSAPIHVGWPLGGLAIDHADGTLWAIVSTWANDSVIRLDNFDRTGRHLGSVTVPRSFSEGAAGAEFAWPSRR